MDPREDRTSLVRSRLLSILSIRMQPGAVVTKSQTSNPTSFTDEPATGTTQNISPSLPQIPPHGFGSLDPDETTRRALTPIVEGSIEASRLPTVEAAVASAPRPGNSSGANNPPVPSSSAPRREESEGQSSARLSTPSAYSPTEGPSLPVSPPRGRSEESAANTSIAKPSPEAMVSLAAGGPNQRPSIDNSNGGTPDVGRVSSPTSVRSLRSSVVSPPSLSPANSSNPPASVSPAQAPPRTPSPRYSILTSPHSTKDSPARPNQSFAEIAAETLGRQPLTPPADPRAASRLGQDSVQMSTDSSRDVTHGIHEEAGAVYYIHQFERDSLNTNSEPAQEEDDKTEIPRPSQYIVPTIAPLRPKTTSPPPPPNSARSLLSIDTAHRKPPIQPLPRTPTLDYGPERRPAGARAAPVSNRQDSVTSSAQQPRSTNIRTVGNVPQGNMSQVEDLEVYAAALTFLDRHDDDAPPAPAPAPSALSAAALPPSHPNEEPPVISEPNLPPPTPESENASVYKSSFAPSKNAMERKARTEAQQAAHEAATHRPGRVMGRPKNKFKSVGTWQDSSEEEDEEEEDEEDVDSDGQPVAPRDDRSVSNYAASLHQRSRVPSPRGPSPLAGAVDAPPPTQPMPRPPRNLPPVPVLRGQGTSHLHYLSCMS
jgi:CCR4-NOT transcriptional complex subunit CAF120